MLKFYKLPDRQPHRFAPCLVADAKGKIAAEVLWWDGEWVDTPIVNLRSKVHQEWVYWAYVADLRMFETAAEAAR